MEKENKKIIIKNNFFDLIFLFFWFIVFWINSLLLLFNLSKNNKLNNNKFFKDLDFILKIWPKYFWEYPTWYKLTSFVWNTFKYIFDRK